MQLIARSIARLLAIMAVVVPLFVWLPTAAHAQSFEGHWIEVDLSNHTATAWDGDTAVYTAPVSAGRPGWETGTGVYTVYYRVYNETMDSSTIGIPNGAPGGYYLPNVMYTQYFNGGQALHGNYWADPSVFGNDNTSHGCVGMSDGDAAYFWSFADVGTPVEIHW